ncbi:MAG: hypothetical protein WA160_13660 [Pseudobdellovibrio sp.]
MKSILIFIMVQCLFGCSPFRNSSVLFKSDSSSSPFVLVCPFNYVMVPANATLGTAEFCVAKYEMKAKTNAGINFDDGAGGGGPPLEASLYIPDSRASGLPWVQITLPIAISECTSLGAGYKLITQAQWNALARDIESVGANWSSGAVGSGLLAKGHTDGAISGTAVTDGYAIGASFLLVASADSYAGTGNTSSQAFGAGGEQKRTHVLSNEQIIWDVSGNAKERVDFDGLGGAVNYTGPAASGFYDMLSPELSSTVLSTASTNAISLN